MGQNPTKCSKTPGHSGHGTRPLWFTTRMISAGVVTQVTLVTADLPEASAFYGGPMGGEEVYRDESCAVFRLGGMLVNLLVESEGRALVAPSPLGAPGGRRAIVTLEVADVDTSAAALEQAGVPLLNGPIDRPWGPRTATFADPDGYVWELAQAT